MPQQAKPVTTIADFLGMTDVPRSNVNSPPGKAAEQVNSCSTVEGQLIVRLGTKEVHFEDA